MMPMTLTTLNRPSLWTTRSLGEFGDLQDEINRLLDEPLAELRGEFFTGWAPPMDLIENAENLVATVEIPGLKKEDIQVRVEDGVLSISGERKRDEKSQKAEAHRTERFYGKFHRAICLPKPVKVDAVKAAYRDGVLTVTMPKTEEAKPKQIEVRMG